MIDAMIRFSIRRRGVVISLAILLAVAGLVAIRTTPVDAIPDLSEDQVLVFADWPGHSPREVEDQLCYPLSNILEGIAEVRSVRASSEFNFCVIHLILRDGANVATVRLDVSERLRGAVGVLPAGVVPKLGPDAAPTGQIYWYMIDGKGLHLGRLRGIQDGTVKPRLAAIPGVAEVASVGGFPIEYEVAILPDQLLAREVTLSQVVEAIGESNSSVGGQAIQKANAEFLVRGVGLLGSRPGDGAVKPDDVLHDLERIVVLGGGGKPVRLSEIASIHLAPGPRRGVLEMDGSEVVGGVVVMARGGNPREVTRRIRDAIRDLQKGLPRGVVIRPFYDRTPLIDGAIATVTTTVIEAIVTASLCIVILLLHVRTSFIIAVTLPLAAIGSFAIMGALRALGIVDIETNVMSLSGIAISIGILVDSSIVMAENVMHRLRLHFGDAPVRGDVRSIVLPACLLVGRPIVFSVAIMLLSFLPVFALGGIEGKMFRPLAFTKTFALVTVAVLSITLVPALCTLFIRGRLRREDASPIVKGVIEVYRPILNSLLDRPAPLAWLLGVTFLVGIAPIGSRPALLSVLFLSLLACGWTASRNAWRVVALGSLILVALTAERFMTPIGREFLTPLDEGMVMDMPITVPRASVTQSGDDLKARDMILCRFPEVDMVVGKAGRAETPTDPAPIDMIETMVNLRPREFWPRRVLSERDASRMLDRVRQALEKESLIPASSVRPDDRSRPAGLLARFDPLMREYAHQRDAELIREQAGKLTMPLDGAWTPEQRRIWDAHRRGLDSELSPRAASLFSRLAIEELLATTPGADRKATAAIERARRNREIPEHHSGSMASGHHAAKAPPRVAEIAMDPRLDGIHEALASELAKGLVLDRVERSRLLGPGGELDRAVSMPGWSNIWTMPIQNRVDMLSTGVNTAVGVRVTGRTLDDVVSASEAISEALKHVPGAVDVVADPIRGKGYLEIRVDREKAARLGVSVGDANDAIEIALGGRVAATTIEGRERHPVRVRYARDYRADEESAREILIPTLGSDSSPRRRRVKLGEVADVRITEGPATIKSEDGSLRNYVRLNVEGRSASDVVADAKRVVARDVHLPDGVFLAWVGQFEHEARARRTLMTVVPVVVALIFAILYWTYHDLADALLMLTAVPGAVAGGVFFQWLFGYPFTVTAWVGYIACFGMATSTGIIMLVYLREAIDRAGGLESMSLEGLREAVLSGAVQRLRPKLLTEGTTIIGLAPLLWADGPGAEIIRPMAAPVLGGLLVADEVIDLFLPVLFFHVRKRRWRRIQTTP